MKKYFCIDLNPKFLSEEKINGTLVFYYNLWSKWLFSLWKIAIARATNLTKFLKGLLKSRLSYYAIIVLLVPIYYIILCIVCGSVNKSQPIFNTVRYVFMTSMAEDIGRFANEIFNINWRNGPFVWSER